jgi:hypothetical protein
VTAVSVAFALKLQIRPTKLTPASATSRREDESSTRAAALILGFAQKVGLSVRKADE